MIERGFHFMINIGGDGKYQCQVHLPHATMIRTWGKMGHKRGHVSLAKRRRYEERTIGNRVQGCLNCNSESRSFLSAKDL